MCGYDETAEGDGYGERYIPSAQGLLTGSLTGVVGNTEINGYLWHSLYYDAKGRVVQERASRGAGVTDKTSYAYDYRGNVTGRRIAHSYGLNTVTTETYAYYYDGWGRPTTKDHQLNGGTAETSTHTVGYLYGAKEWDGNLSLYDFSARWYNPSGAVSFTTMDPLCEKYYGISPYAYCAENPVNLVDPSGKSTWVYLNRQGTYTIFGGDRYDNDRSVYVYTKDENGDYTQRGNSIGESLTILSFYDTDSKAWKNNSVIDLSDTSGEIFFNSMINDNVPLGLYMEGAQNGKEYDFKATNGGKEPIPGLDYYRGMPLLTRADGTKVIASARDIGNVVAGYYAGSNGWSWTIARAAFDKYQGHGEGLSTQAAQYQGWLIGRNQPIINKLINFNVSLPSNVTRGLKNLMR